MILGIYKLYFKSNPDKVYIGSASGVKSKYEKRRGFYGRLYTHGLALINKRHHSPKLQNYVNKYGFEGISFEIIELCSKDQLKEREEYFIRKYDAVKIGFNCTHDGYSNGGIISKEVKLLANKKTSDALKGRIPDNWLSIKGIRAKPVLELINNIIVKEYKSLTIMCIENNLSYKTYSQVLRKKIRLPRKFINENKYWIYKEEYEANLNRH